MKIKIKNGKRSKFHNFPCQLAFRLTPSIVIGIIFFLLWSELAKGHLEKIEKSILLAFRSSGNSDILIGPDWIPQVVRSVAFLGDSIFLILMVFAVSGLLIAKRAYLNALLLPILSMSGFWMVFLLKDFFDRPRPSIVEYLSIPNSASFPSGHAANSTIVYILIALALLDILPERYARIYLFFGAFVLTVLIGISRIALGVHWPSDVLGGWVLGLGWSCLWLLKDGRPDASSAFSPISKAE